MQIAGMSIQDPTVACIFSWSALICHSFSYDVHGTGGIRGIPPVAGSMWLRMNSHLVLDIRISHCNIALQCVELLEIWFPWGTSWSVFVHVDCLQFLCLRRGDNLLDFRLVFFLLFLFRSSGIGDNRLLQQ